MKEKGKKRMVCKGSDKWSLTQLETEDKRCQMQKGEFLAAAAAAVGLREVNDVLFFFFLSTHKQPEQQNKNKTKTKTNE